MGTPYTEVIDNFSKMITEYKLTELSEEERDGWMTALMNSALAKFQRTNPEKFVRDGTEFENELDDLEIDIICNLMIVEWLKPYLFSVDNLENLMTTKDWAEYSPANLLRQIRETYDLARLQSKNMVKNYTYTLRKYKRGEWYD
ncbi:hypothetical protein RASY3_14300 [Ruminococcus albus SY3]|uniref:Uncharacterized protein n=1 Tax=Ruminococcus albus SY3 TaxID=1341156 RepID=A0A011WNG4_RUMAL|nr:hypothetical protein [Ruminococcus albus]EXM38505.1 hypothetical protein RASY3_14300 [Ruminococcus albus SY3]